jgi:hypothetical protein
MEVHGIGAYAFSDFLSRQAPELTERAQSPEVEHGQKSVASRHARKWEYCEWQGVEVFQSQGSAGKRSVHHGGQVCEIRSFCKNESEMGDWWVPGRGGAASSQIDDQSVWLVVFEIRAKGFGEFQ